MTISSTSSATPGKIHWSSAPTTAIPTTPARSRRCVRSEEKAIWLHRSSKDPRRQSARPVCALESLLEFGSWRFANVIDRCRRPCHRDGKNLGLLRRQRPPLSAGPHHRRYGFLEHCKLLG